MQQLKTLCVACRRPRDISQMVPLYQGSNIVRCDDVSDCISHAAAKGTLAKIR